MGGAALTVNSGGATNIGGTPGLVMDNWNINQKAALGEGIATGAIEDGSAGSGGGATAFFLQTTLNASGAVPKTREENLTSVGNAGKTLAKLDTMIPHLAAATSRIGGYIAQMEFSSDYSAGRAVVMEDAASKVGDTDYAVQTAKLASQSIVSQAATAILAQANSRSSTVLTLLK